MLTIARLIRLIDYNINESGCIEFNNKAYNELLNFLDNKGMFSTDEITQLVDSLDGYIIKRYSIALRNKSNIFNLLLEYHHVLTQEQFNRLTNRDIYINEKYIELLGLDLPNDIIIMHINMFYTLYKDYKSSTNTNTINRMNQDLVINYVIATRDITLLKHILTIDSSRINYFTDSLLFKHEFLLLEEIIIFCKENDIKKP